MHIQNICRCQAHGYVKGMPASLFFRLDPKKVRDGSASTPPAHYRPLTQYVAVPSTAQDAICCVSSLSRDRLLTPEKGRFAYSPAVVHFRKVQIWHKVGSDRNGHPVIYRSGYMATYYQTENDNGLGKSSW